MMPYTVECVLREHGPEILGWMLATLATETEAADAYALFGEDLWRSLGRHAGRCSMRTWCYMLARHAVARVIEQRGRGCGHEEPLSDASAFRIAAPDRTSTAGYLRIDAKRSVRALREQLEPEDQVLLVLRVDKDLGWRDIALVMLGPDADEAALARRGAALRKRFERVKERLRRLAAEARPAVRGPELSSTTA
jgi:RNA polymerase sigma-70 factor (ECF subfamily)